jgi:hypothetical protein
MSIPGSEKCGCRAHRGGLFMLVQYLRNLRETFLNHSSTPARADLNLALVALPIHKKEEFGLERPARVNFDGQLDSCD